MSESVKHRVPPYRRPIIVGGFLLILAAVIVITVFIFKNFIKLEDKTSNQPVQPAVSEQQPSQDNPDPKDNDEEPLENKAPQYEGEDPNNLPELTGVITYADIDTENQVLHSAVSINQYLETDGQCVFNLKRGGSILRTASSVASPDVTTSVCGPFSISLVGLDSGIYQIEIIMTGAGKRGIINSEVEI